MRKLTCERCHAAAGSVFHVSVTSQFILLFVRCERCRHRWVIDGQTPPIAP